MKLHPLISSALLTLALSLTSLSHLQADDIVAAISVDGNRFLSALPNGGLHLLDTTAITGKETFTIKNLNGTTLENSAQIQIFWYKTALVVFEDKIGRTDKRAAKDSNSLFELVGENGEYRLRTPNGSWFGPATENNRGFQVVDDEASALIFTFVPQSTP
ncbi:MAG: hypothetical protein ACK5LK_07005 [Chthoniobacterales bacterium]